MVDSEVLHWRKMKRWNWGGSYIYLLYIQTHTHTHIYIYIYIYISAQLISNEDLGEPEDESAQTRAVDIGCCLWLPFSINRVLKLKDVTGVSCVTSTELCYAPSCLTCWALFGSLVSAMCNCVTAGHLDKCMSYHRVIAALIMN